MKTIPKVYMSIFKCQQCLQKKIASHNLVTLTLVKQVSD